MAGHGIAQTFEFGVDPLLASGELVQILADWAEGHFPPYAYDPSRHLPPAKVRVFLDFVLASVPGSSELDRISLVRQATTRRLADEQGPAGRLGRLKKSENL